MWNTDSYVNLCHTAADLHCALERLDKAMPAL